MVADRRRISTSFEVVRDIGRGGPLKTESFFQPLATSRLSRHPW